MMSLMNDSIKVMSIMNDPIGYLYLKMSNAKAEINSDIHLKGIFYGKMEKGRQQQQQQQRQQNKHRI